MSSEVNEIIQAGHDMYVSPAFLPCLRSDPAAVSTSTKVNYGSEAVSGS